MYGISCCQRPAADVVADLQRDDPASFGLLAELVPGAYFLNPEVRALLAYSGQGPRPIASTQPVGAEFAKVSFMQPR